MEAVWKGLFEWSMQQQGDGTRPEPRPLLEEDRRWLEEALKSAMIDLNQRMKDIKETLEAGEGAEGAADAAAAEGGGAAANVSLQDKERLLDELMDIVETIDLARDLQTIGGLQTLLELLGSPHPSLRWRAAEVAATCVQNNPPTQEAFLKGGIMPRLLPLLHDDNATVQTKACLAISCMVRGYPPAMLLLRQLDGLATLVGLLKQQEPRLQRKCLQVLQYMLRVMPLDRASACTDTPLLQRLSSLLEGDDNDLREAALAVAQQLAADDASLYAMQQAACGLRSAVEALQVRLDTLPPEEWGAVQEEVAAAKQLTEALQREVPPPAAAAAAAGGSALPPAVVDDSSTTGAPAAALQLVAVAPAADAAADAPRALQLN